MIASAGIARAQPALQGTEPARNTRIDAPIHVTLRFNEPLDAKSSGAVVELTTPPERSGPGFGRFDAPLRPKTTGVDPSDPPTLAVEFSKPLKEGFYTVRWRAAGADGRRASGLYFFFVT